MWQTSDLSVLRKFVGPILLAALVSFFTVSCATPYQERIQLEPRVGVSISEGVRIAAQAMQDIGFWPTLQNESAGTITGRRTDKTSFGLETYTRTLDIVVAQGAGGNFAIDAKCSVSENVAYWDEGDECVAEFWSAFNKRLVERGTARTVLPRPMPQRDETPGTHPVSPPPAVPAAKEYDL